MSEEERWYLVDYKMNISSLKTYSSISELRNLEHDTVKLNKLSNLTKPLRLTSYQKS